MGVEIPPLEEQWDLLSRGTVDLHPVDSFKQKLVQSHREQKPLCIKLGLDPTASDIHLGHTVPLEKLRQFQSLGHEVVFLIGDYTALIGDPTGRNTLRPPLSSEAIKRNADTYSAQAFKILDRDKTRIEWNSKWLAGLSFSDTIKLASKYNVGRMLERRDFRKRLDENKQIAIHEFLYPLMQGYDSVVLNSDIELGGHDQVFNLNVGRHLMESYGQTPQCVLTVPLLVGLDGKEKMSKSKGNHIGVTESPEDMFGKVMSIDDETMWAWQPLLNPAPVSKTESTPLEAKKQLAEQIVARFHGPSSGRDLLAWWNAGRPPRNVDLISVPGGPLFSIVVAAGLATSNKDARRKIEQGGVALDEEKLKDSSHVVDPGTYLLKVGKKSLKRIKVTK